MTRGRFFRLMLTVVLAVIALSAVGAALAQDEDVYEEARDLYANGDYEAAIEKLDIYLGAQTIGGFDLAKGLSRRGWAYYHLGKFPAALEDLNAAEAADSTFINPPLGRAWVYLDGGEFEKAKADFEKVIELDEDYDDAYYGLVIMALAEGDPDAAYNNLKEMHRSAEVKDTQSLYYDVEVLGYLLLDIPQEAFDAVDSYLDDNPDEGFAYFYRALANIGLEDYDAAIADLDKMEEIEPTYDYFNMIWRITIARLSGNGKEAARMLTNAQKLFAQDEDSVAPGVHGLLALMSNDGDTAQSYFEDRFDTYAFRADWFTYEAYLTLLGYYFPEKDVYGDTLDWLDGELDSVGQDALQGAA